MERGLTGLSVEAQQELDRAIELLMERQVCDAALDGAAECPRPRPCAFHERLGHEERHAGEA